MRIAVLADIHGNVLALDAVLADLARRGGADRLVNLGDCVSGPLWPAETMHRLAGLDASTVRGNHDRQVATHAPERMIASDRYAFDQLSSGQRQWLGVLPMVETIEPGLLACHAVPTRDDLYLLDAVHDGRLVRDGVAAVAKRVGDVGSSRIVLCAHSHRADMLRLPSGVLVLNPGSVGCPAYDDGEAEPPHVSEAGSSHARYALLTFHAGRAPEEADIEFVAVCYDVAEAARRATVNGRPEWAHALRTGVMPTPADQHRSKSAVAEEQMG